jgi:hypothetical protein
MENLWIIDIVTRRIHPFKTEGAIIIYFLDSAPARTTKWARDRIEGEWIGCITWPRIVGRWQYGVFRTAMLWNINSLQVAPVWQILSVDSPKELSWCISPFRSRSPFVCRVANGGRPLCIYIYIERCSSRRNPPRVTSNSWNSRNFTPWDSTAETGDFKETVSHQINDNIGYWGSEY